MLDIQTQFVISELWILSWNASVQRSLAYRAGVQGSDRSRFRSQVIDHIQETILPAYISECAQEQHIENILDLVSFANEVCGGRILSKSYNIGIGQKLLNLQLKYLWCIGQVARPPHCPIDRIILAKTCLKNRMNWTEIDSVFMYVEAIEAIKEIAGNMHIADWELATYQRQTPN